ncbi:MAG: bifunctional phosphoribosylaminoimidazolecarboxamide formyltransferase/IMP cyclohydrolase [Pseudomonadota bacterium]
MLQDRVTPARALISVSDKTGLADLGRALAGRGVELVSTGGTAAALRDAGLAVRDVADLTGLPEMMDGRVKTLHPGVHGGLLADRDLAPHMQALATHGFAAIDLLVVNLYPFEATVARGAGPAEVIENIDIGGPAMLRAAAKNHAAVGVVTEPQDQAALLAELDAQDGATTLAFRRRMAARAYARTAAYDAAVAGWMADHAGDTTPARISLAGRLQSELRYGENPHQTARFYATGPAPGGLAAAEQHQGKALSYNNILDTDAALALAADLPADRPGVAIIKHANPCGVGSGDTLAQAYRAAFDGDRVSAFGGIVALNRPLDAATAAAIAEIFVEVIIAPGAAPEAREILAAKPNLRLLTLPAMPDATAAGTAWRQVAGGLLMQDRDTGRVAAEALKVVTARAPSDAETEALLFAWRVAKHVKSNAIVFARDGRTVGIGAGQMSRVDSVRIAVRKAQDMAQTLGCGPLTQGAVLASDAFFPFADGLEAAIDAGIAAVIQPGGSKRDAEVIAAADAAGIAMVFTTMRHFRH